MNLRRIHSKNADFQKFEVLKTNRNKRHRYGEFFVEGVRNINEAIRNGWRISAFLYSPDKPLSRWARGILDSVEADTVFELPAALMEELSGKEDTSELLAVIRMREDDTSGLRLSDKPVLALLDRPSNRGNLGTIIRSCDALGVEALLITGHAVDLYDPDTVVSTMGSLFSVPVVRMAENAEAERFFLQMKERYPDFAIIGTSAHAETALFDIDMDRPLLFLIGNETDGLSSRYLERCDVVGRIPHALDSAATSLNVACAATAMFYEAIRQRAIS